MNIDQLAVRTQGKANKTYSGWNKKERIAKRRRAIQIKRELRERNGEIEDNLEGARVEGKWKHPPTHIHTDKVHRHRRNGAESDRLFYIVSILFMPEKENDLYSRWLIRGDNCHYSPARPLLFFLCSIGPHKIYRRKKNKTA